MGSSAGIRICVSSQALYTARDAKTESINMNPELSRGPDGGNVSTQYRGSGACLETQRYPHDDEPRLAECETSNYYRRFARRIWRLRDSGWMRWEGEDCQDIMKDQMPRNRAGLERHRASAPAAQCSRW